MVPPKERQVLAHFTLTKTIERQPPIERQAEIMLEECQTQKYLKMVIENIQATMGPSHSGTVLSAFTLCIQLLCLYVNVLVLAGRAGRCDDKTLRNLGSIGLFTIILGLCALALYLSLALVLAQPITYVPFGGNDSSHQVKGEALQNYWITAGAALLALRAGSLLLVTSPKSDNEMPRINIHLTHGHKLTRSHSQRHSPSPHAIFTPIQTPVKLARLAQFNGSVYRHNSAAVNGQSDVKRLSDDSTLPNSSCSDRSSECDAFSSRV